MFNEAITIKAWFVLYSNQLLMDPLVKSNHVRDHLIVSKSYTMAARDFADIHISQSLRTTGPRAPGPRAAGVYILANPKLQ